LTANPTWLYRPPFFRYTYYALAVWLQIRPGSLKDIKDKGIFPFQDYNRVAIKAIHLENIPKSVYVACNIVDINTYVNGMGLGCLAVLFTDKHVYNFSHQELEYFECNLASQGGVVEIMALDEHMTLIPAQVILYFDKKI